MYAHIMVSLARRSFGNNINHCVKTWSILFTLCQVFWKTQYKLLIPLVLWEV